MTAIGLSNKRGAYGIVLDNQGVHRGHPRVRLIWIARIENQLVTVIAHRVVYQGRGIRRAG